MSVQDIHFSSGTVQDTPPNKLHRLKWKITVISW